MVSEFEFDMDRVLAACTHGPEFRGICAGCTRAAVLLEVREAVEEAFEQPVDAATMIEDIATRFNRVLELFATGGRFAVEGEEGE